MLYGCVPIAEIRNAGSVEITLQQLFAYILPIGSRGVDPGAAAGDGGMGLGVVIVVIDIVVGVPRAGSVGSVSSSIWSSEK